MRQLTWICGVDSPRALPLLPVNLLIAASLKSIVALVSLGIAIALHNRDITCIYHQP
jgi:hypothetical protein